jgi:hypothetical protein
MRLVVVQEVCLETALLVVVLRRARTWIKNTRISWRSWMENRRLRLQQQHRHRHLQQRGVQESEESES